MESSRLCFTESQAFRQAFLWLFLWTLLVGWAIWVTVQIGMGIPVGDRPMTDNWLILSGLLPVGLVILFWQLRLYVQIESTGISFRFAPFMQWKHIDWSEIETMEIRQYAPLREFGGWGFRYNGTTRALTVSGDLGLEITLQSGGVWLIGTQDPEGIQQGLVSCAPAFLWQS